MGLKYTKLPTDAFEHIQLNAGILVDSFVPATGVIGNIMGATSGGINFNSNPTYTDFGEDIDNCPPNTKQLKRISYYDPTMTGTFLTCTPAVIASLLGAGKVDVTDATKVIPKAQLEAADFTDLWWIGDYSDVNTGDNAGFLAVHLIAALNTTGFQIQSGKDSKGTMSFEYHGHYDLTDADLTPPFEIYCQAGETGTETPSITLNEHAVTLLDGGEYTLTATVKNSTSNVTWTSGSGSVASVSGGVVTAEGAGNTIVTASITENGVTYTDTCTVIVTE